MEELIENYGSTENAAWSQSRYLYEHGLFDASVVIDTLLKERNQLLEALKLLSSNLKSQSVELSYSDFRHMDKVAKEAILRVEGSYE